MTKKVPKQEDMYEAVLAVIKKLGGSATRQEIDEGVAEYMNLSDEQIDQLHSESGTRTKLNYNLAWSRTYLKTYGLLENSGRGVWLLTPKGYSIQKVDKKRVKAHLRAKHQLDKNEDVVSDSQIESKLDTERSWRSELIKVILEMPPGDFERLCQLILRKSGFVEVEVLGRPNDGGIDGKGSMQLSGLLKFQCYFQCKRWQSSVGAKEIRDFRGAMAGRSDKGLFITTSSFTKSAQEEADRDGVATIELIDGEAVLDKMKELGLGLEKITTYRVDRGWFEEFMGP